MPRSGSTYNFGLCIFSNDVIVYRVNLQTKTNTLQHVKMTSAVNSQISQKKFPRVVLFFASGSSVTK